ncbi:hypothetical protein GCM10027516_21210 [Niabella aquatica]
MQYPYSLSEDTLFILKSINEKGVHFIKFSDQSIEKNDKAVLIYLYSKALHFFVYSEVIGLIIADILIARRQHFSYTTENYGI